MRRNLEQRTVRSLCRRRTKINIQPDYQRGAVWSTPQKQLLIDSILQDLDIPKIYLRDVNNPPFQEEAVDGQQRLSAIWGYFANEFPLSSECDPVGTKEVANLRYNDLDEELKDIFEAYEFSVVILRDATSEDVEEMFLRLQNGTSLNAAEKRNAMPGQMKLLVRDLAQHRFFECCGFRNTRFAYNHVAAQMVLSELNGGICNIKNTDLAKMYGQNETFEANGSKARKVRRVLDYLANMFPAKTPELKKFNAISLYILISYLLEQFAIRDRDREIADWFIEFETQRKEDERRPVDEREPEMVSYLERTSHATDSQDSLEFRHHVLLRHLHEKLPNLAPLDPQRSFDADQRLAIFRRDCGLCQLRIACSGVKCEWDNWHCDHRRAWSAGGPTTVENGQVACPECNLRKSDRPMP